MNVAVSLLTAQAEHVEALRRYDGHARSAQTMDDELNRSVFVASEVGDNVFAVVSWGDERVAALRRILAQECDVAGISVDDMLLVTAIALNDAADEAVPTSNAPLVRGRIEGQTARRLHVGTLALRHR